MITAGCDDDTSAPRDLTPPAAPRGFYSVTGDGSVTLYWLENTERDLSGYRVFMSDCSSGQNCPYLRVGTTAGTTFTVNGLTNGVTQYFAVAAVDFAGNESPLTYEYVEVFDTPRPAGFGVRLTDVDVTPATSGWDFSSATRRPFDDDATDMYFGQSGGTFLMYVWDDTDIQDAGWAPSLDAVDFAPDDGWAPSRSAELVQGHCYVVWTWDDHYAKFRVTSVAAGEVMIDWAYQVDTGNRELRAHRAHGEERTFRPSLAAAAR
jgi:hypothetical protein